MYRAKSWRISLRPEGMVLGVCRRDTVRGWLQGQQGVHRLTAGSRGGRRQEGQAVLPIRDSHTNRYYLTPYPL